MAGLQLVPVSALFADVPNYSPDGGVSDTAIRAVAALCAAVAAGHIPENASASLERRVADLADALRAGLDRLDQAAMPEFARNAARAALCAAIAGGNVPCSPAQSLQQCVVALADALLTGISRLTEQSPSPR